MEELKSEQTEVTVSGEEKQVLKKTEDEVSLGKFKDAQSLLKAYNSLQSEFTKRCQRIKELEGAVNVDKKDANDCRGGVDKTSDGQADFPTDTAKGDGSLYAALNAAPLSEWSR